MSYMNYFEVCKAQPYLNYEKIQDASIDSGFGSLNFSDADDNEINRTSPPELTSTTTSPIPTLPKVKEETASGTPGKTKSTSPLWFFSFNSLDKNDIPSFGCHIGSCSSVLKAEKPRPAGFLGHTNSLIESQDAKVPETPPNERMDSIMFSNPFVENSSVMDRQLIPKVSSPAVAEESLTPVVESGSTISLEEGLIIGDTNTREQSSKEEQITATVEEQRTLIETTHPPGPKEANELNQNQASIIKESSNGSTDAEQAVSVSKEHRTNDEHRTNEEQITNEEQRTTRKAVKINECSALSRILNKRNFSRQISRAENLRTLDENCKMAESAFYEGKINVNIYLTFKFLVEEVFKVYAKLENVRKSNAHLAKQIDDIKEHMYESELMAEKSLFFSKILLPEVRTSTLGKSS